MIFGGKIFGALTFILTPIPSVKTTFASIYYSSPLGRNADGRISWSHRAARNKKFEFLAFITCLWSVITCAADCTARFAGVPTEEILRKTSKSAWENSAIRGALRRILENVKNIRIKCLNYLSTRRD